jgi:hypothetical protein
MDDGGKTCFRKHEPDELDGSCTEDAEEEAEEAFGGEFVEETPMAKENRKLSGSLDYEREFHRIFLDIYDLEDGYVRAKESYTNALLNNGMQVNPQDLYGFTDMVLQRLAKIRTIKRMCMLLGLHVEMDGIVEHELNLIYNSRKAGSPSTGMIVGDIRNEERRKEWEGRVAGRRSRKSG